MARMFQIYEDDLAVLERGVPLIADALDERIDNRLRTKIRQVQRVLTNVRWNYGPHTDVERVDASEEADDA